MARTSFPKSPCGYKLAIFHNSFICVTQKLVIKNEENLTRVKVIQCLGGHQIPDRKKYADCNTRIMNIVQYYPALLTLEYLRRIAYNLLQK